MVSGSRQMGQSGSWDGVSCAVRDGERRLGKKMHSKVFSSQRLGSHVR